ncbi:MAG: hypothetical protein AAF604_04680 [Acidobacteriota bacterium]
MLRLTVLAAAILIFSSWTPSQASPPDYGAWIETVVHGKATGRVYITAESDGSTKHTGMGAVGLHLVAVDGQTVTVEVRRLADGREVVTRLRPGRLLQELELRQGAPAVATMHEPALALRLVRVVPLGG